MSLLFIVALAVVVWILYSQHLAKLLAQGRVGKIKLACMALGLIFLLLAITGRAPALFAIIGAALTQTMRIAPLAVRFAPFLKRYLGGGMSAAANAGQSSVVSTSTILMKLDHNSGKVTGDVIDGEFSGRSLDSLSINELQSLHRHCLEHDSEAAKLLMTFIARERSEHWQESETPQDSYSASSGQVTHGEMSLEEARQVLGLDEGILSKESITTAHRLLIGRFHPDKGGNDYIASKINTARSILIKQLKRVG